MPVNCLLTDRKLLKKILQKTHCISLKDDRPTVIHFAQICHTPKKSGCYVHQILILHVVGNLAII